MSQRKRERERETELAQDEEFEGQSFHVEQNNPSQLRDRHQSTFPPNLLVSLHREVAINMQIHIAPSNLYHVDGNIIILSYLIPPGPTVIHVIAFMLR